MLHLLQQNIINLAFINLEIRRSYSFPSKMYIALVISAQIGVRTA